jgi:response regulator RpfG family c-di-GMP phosphodiesterase
MGRVLLVDDDENNLSAMRRLLRLETEHDVETFTRGEEALQRARGVEFDVVVADYRMPEMDGTEFMEAFRLLQPTAYRIIASAFSDSELFRKAINQAQIHRFIQKPWDGFLLVEAITRGAEQSAMSRELDALRGEVKRLTNLLEGVAARQPQLLPPDWRTSPDEA